MTKWQLPVETKVSQTDDFADLERLDSQRQIDYLLDFDYIPDVSRGGSFRVRLQGPGSEGGYAPFEGRTDYSLEDAELKIRALREVWHREVLDYRAPSQGGTVYPYLTGGDASPFVDSVGFGRLGLKLAQAGADFFDFIFGGGDSGMRAIRGLLETEFLRQPGRVVAIRADQLHAPWQLMYVQPSKLNALDGADAEWEAGGFLGVSHLVNHTYRRSLSNWTSRISLGKAGRPSLAAYVDRGLDAGAIRPCVYPVLTYFAGKTDLEVFDQRHDVARVLRQGSSHDVIYFLCHTELGREGLDEPSYALTDGEPFTPLDVKQWLRDQSLSNPLVFLATCQGGKLGTSVGSLIGQHFLDAGANSLVGPHIELPQAIVPGYVFDLFELMLKGFKLGDALRTLSGRYLAEYHNPLALSFAAIRGLDTRFVGLN